MSRPMHTLLPFLLSLTVGTAACVPPTHAYSTANPPDRMTPAIGRASIAIESPLADAAVQGVVIIRFRTENISIESPFRTAEHHGVFPAGHVHVTVDGAPWHWVHASSDPVVVTPLPAGEHTVELELADAGHRRLDSKIVRFTVVVKTAHTTEHTVPRR
jgi:hypothetical protein